MEDYLAIIKRIIEWHQTIREHVKLVGESISDREALTSLERTRADWIPGRPGFLAEIQMKMQQAISFLGDGLKRHFAYEEEVLPPVLGELFMQALILEHQEIMEAIEEAKPIATDTRLEGLGRDELLAKELEVQQTVSNMCRLVEEHTTREEIILDMVRRALEDKGYGKG